MACLTEDEALAFVERRMDPREMSRVDAHLDRCARCRELLAAVAGIYGPLATRPPDEGETGAAADDSPALVRGATVGRYIVVDLVGVGGMGSVYMAYDPELDRRVALKVLRTDRGLDRSGSYQARLRREAQVLARLSHANVVAVYDVGTFGGQVFIAMQYVEGQTLRRWREERLRTWREILQVLLQAGRGLAAAHRAGMVHRDFKPENVLVGRDGGVWVTDFGLARSRGDEDHAPQRDALRQEFSSPPPDVPLTVTGTTLGTPAYMSPEQRRGEAADARSDQYSFCLTLQEALEDASPPTWLERLLARGRAEDPGERHVDMDSLLLALSRDPARRRRRVFATLGLASALAAAALGGWALLGPGRNPCGGAGEKLRGVWDGDRKTAVRQAFTATGRPFAGNAASGVEKALEAYTRDLVTGYVDACEATHVRGEQSEVLLDLRISCLDRRRDEVRALTDVFTSADQDVVQNAVQAVGALSPIEGCANAELLLDRVRLPADPGEREAIEEIRALLARAKALQDAGKYKEALATLPQEAEGVAHLPTRAEFLLRRGSLLQETADHAGAEKALFDAVWAAEAGRHDEMAARAWVEILHLTGLVLERHKEARRWSQRASAAIARLGGDPKLRASYLREMGSLALREGKFTAARESYDRALALFEKAYGPHHLQSSVIHNSLGILAVRQADSERAIQHFREARSIITEVYGEAHPRVAALDDNMGVVLRGAGRLEESLAHHRRALRAKETLLGKEHTDLAYSVHNIGSTLVKMERYDEALAAFRRSLGLWEQAFGPDHPKTAASLLNLGITLKNLGRHEEALRTLQRTAEVYERTLGPEHPDVALALANSADVLDKMKRHKDAVAVLERAVAIFRKVLEEGHPRLVNATRALAKARERLK